MSPPGSHSDRAGSLSISIKSCSFTSKSKQCLYISHCFHHLDLRKAQGIRKALPGPTLHRGSLFTPKLLCFYLFCLFVCLLICNFFPSLLPEWIATPHVEGLFLNQHLSPDGTIGKCTANWAIVQKDTLTGRVGVHRLRILESWFGFY